MIVPASGHQVRCIPWVQMGTFDKEIGFYVDQNSLHWLYFVGNTYNWVYIWCCKYGENRYCERCTNKKWCASKHTGLLNSCLGKSCLLPYLAVPLISAKITLISTRVSAHCDAILLRQTLVWRIRGMHNHNQIQVFWLIAAAVNSQKLSQNNINKNWQFHSWETFC